MGSDLVLWPADDQDWAWLLFREMAFPQSVNPTWSVHPTVPYLSDRALEQIGAEL